jgi:hypothetical protein
MCHRQTSRAGCVSVSPPPQALDYPLQWVPSFVGLKGLHMSAQGNALGLRSPLREKP